MSAHSPNMSLCSSKTSRLSSRSVSEETVKNTLAKLRAENERAEAERKKILADQAELAERLKDQEERAKAEQAELAERLKDQEERAKAEQERILAELSVASSGGSSRRSSVCLTSANDSFKSSFSLQRFLEDRNAAPPSLPTGSPFLQVDGNATLETVVDGGAQTQTPVNLNRETLFQHPESELLCDPSQINTSGETDHWKQTENDVDRNFDFEPGGLKSGVDDASTPLRPKEVLRPPKFQRDQIVTTDQTKIPDFSQIKLPQNVGTQHKGVQIVEQ
jgi:hypothetical protein